MKSQLHKHATQGKTTDDIMLRTKKLYCGRSIAKIAGRDKNTRFHKFLLPV